MDRRSIGGHRPVTAPCTATTKSGKPCKGEASRWPRGVAGDPQLCGTHLPVPLRDIRDAGFAEVERRHCERLDTRTPACWAWAPPSASETDPRYALISWHSGRCAACGYRDARLVMDHDHDTGQVRGLLCRSCNSSEPHDDGLFRRYRERPPAEIIGVQLRYFDPRHGWAEPRAIDPTQLDNHPAYQLAARLGERLQPAEEET
ncbi:endonuclease domain-containing protein [Streptomyces sp. NPDC101249]|uniref:endonuclease domain-containing protein n=1 Tax=Streptomyces sp. NPDC101249 TaxID=3366140 RepID=UPI00382BB959